MDNKDVKLLISEFISLRDELTRLGGAEEAPVLWGRCVDLRSLILKYFALYETTENIKQLDLPKMSETETLGLSFSRSPDDLQTKDARQLEDILNEASIIGANDPRMIEHRKRRIVTRIQEKLYLRAYYLHKSPPLTQLELLELGKTKRLPAKDLILQLGFFNEPYQRFLINIVLFGGYATSEQVLRDLMGSQEINNIWGFTEYYNDSLLERQLGTDNLRASGLRFIEQFLWWERELNFL